MTKSDLKSHRIFQARSRSLLTHGHPVRTIHTLLSQHITLPRQRIRLTIGNFAPRSSGTQASKAIIAEPILLLWFSELWIDMGSVTRQVWCWCCWANSWHLSVTWHVRYDEADVYFWRITRASGSRPMARRKRMGRRWCKGSAHQGGPQIDTCRRYWLRVNPYAPASMFALEA